MSIDRSEGWDAAAAHFMAARTSIGTSLVRMWAQKTLPPGGSVVDVGCGSGFPIAVALSDDGFKIFGIDASPTLIAEFRRNLPCAEAVCEAAQDSEFFHRKFDAAISIGLLFLVDVEAQAKVIRRVSDSGLQRPRHLRRGE